MGLFSGETDWAAGRDRSLIFQYYFVMSLNTDTDTDTDRYSKYYILQKDSILDCQLVLHYTQLQSNAMMFRVMHWAAEH